MAISQSRVIQLIEAGKDYQQALQTLINAIHNQYAYATRTSNPANPLEMLNFIAMMADERQLLKQPTESPAAILLEHRHFAANIQRNKRKAVQMEIKRREAGISERRRGYDPNANLSKLLADTDPSPRLNPNTGYVSEADREYIDSPEHQSEVTAFWEEEERKRLLRDRNDDPAADKTFSQASPQAPESTATTAKQRKEEEAERIRQIELEAIENDQKADKAFRTWLPGTKPEV